MGLSKCYSSGKLQTMFLGQLREYQQEAASLIVNRERCLLALDLGTGKTVVSIAAIEELRERGDVKCAVLIMSSSLTVQWEERIQQFTNTTSVIRIDGSLAKKKREEVWNSILQEPPAYLIMGIRQAVSDISQLKRFKPDLVLVDEVTSIKNFSTQQTKAIKQLKSRYRVGLSAEPIENGKAEELFSIMQWIDPEVLGDWRDFEDRYITRNSSNFIIGYKNMKEMNSRLMEACIVKRKEDPDVSEFMPTVQEFNVFVEMDDATRKLYDPIARELLRELYSAGPSASRDLASYYSGEKSTGDESMGNITSRLLCLQLLLDDPTLLEASAQAYADPNSKVGSKYAHSLLEDGRLPPEGFHGAKLEAAVQLTQEYLEEDPRHKVIIFARFKGVLPLLAAQLDNYGSVLFTGDLNGKQRGEAIASFTNDPDIRLFLSSDAGGYGVDLFAASHLINYDLPMSSGVFKQRNGRHVRASSTFRTVYIDNLIVSESVEEYQLTRLSFKAKVSKAALTGNRATVDDDAKSLTKFLEGYFDCQ